MKSSITMLALTTWLAALTTAAYASDGVIEINQAKIDANAANGLINQPGSYRLTSNLAQTSKDLNVITIHASNVVLDLNGFAIIGANQCTYAPGSPPSVNCSGNGMGYGITGSGAGITIKNGSIKGMGSACVYLNGSSMRLEDLDLSHCGSFGGRIVGGMVTRVTSSYNATQGLDLGTVTLTDSVVHHNGDNGINSFGTIKNSIAHNNVWTGISSYSEVISGSTANSNGNVGLSISIGTAIGNTVEHNAKEGLHATFNVTYSGNLFLGNNGSGSQVSNPGGGTLLNGGGNLCNTVPCP